MSQKVCNVLLTRKMLLIVLNSGNDLLCEVQNLNLPTYNFKVQKRGDHVLIWDDIRKKNLVLTPEEWVRQNFVQFLIQEYGYPASLMQLESGLKYNNLNQRSDILCYNQLGEKLLLVECKRPTVAISQKTFDQIARYNMTLKVPFLAVTNGVEHYFCKVNVKEKSYAFLPNLVPYDSVKTYKC